MRRRAAVGDCVVRVVYDPELNSDVLSIISFSGGYEDNKAIASGIGALAGKLNIASDRAILMRCRSMDAFERTREARWQIVRDSRYDTISIQAVQEAVDMVARTIKERELRGR